MILFNGVTGGLGQYLPAALQKIGLDSSAIRSRLADTAGLKKELDASLANQKTPVRLTFIQIAGLVPVPYCEQHPEEAFQTNVTDTLASLSTALQWAERKGIRLRILYVSTGHLYSQTAPGKLLKEEDPVEPRSVYARTKWEAEKAISTLAAKTQADYLITRVFGLLGPRQPLNYVLPGLIRRVRKLELSGIPGLSYKRDYLDARDVCAHLAQLAKMEWQGPVTPIINICSGEALSIRDLLMKVAQRLGVSPALIEGRLSEGPGRADDLPWIVGDPARLVGLLKHPPRNISLDQTVQDALTNDAARLPG